jgi:hypothetical protein
VRGRFVNRQIAHIPGPDPKYAKFLCGEFRQTRRRRCRPRSEARDGKILARRCRATPLPAQFPKSVPHRRDANRGSSGSASPKQVLKVSDAIRCNTLIPIPTRRRNSKLRMRFPSMENWACRLRAERRSMHALNLPAALSSICANGAPHCVDLRIQRSHRGWIRLKGAAAGSEVFKFAIEAIPTLKFLRLRQRSTLRAMRHENQTGNTVR